MKGLRYFIVVKKKTEKKRKNEDYNIFIKDIFSREIMDIIKSLLKELSQEK